MMTGHVKLPQQYLPTALHSSTRRGTLQNQLCVYAPLVDAHKFSFLPRTVLLWNNLPAEAHSLTPAAFCNKLKLYID